MPDFFNNDCRENPRNEIVFGVCDAVNGGKAYTEIADPSIWIATVRNDRALAITFTAIDKCLINDNEYTGRGRCDGMLTTNEHLYLIELKDRNYPGVNAGALEQLESTVQFLYEYHPQEVALYRHKKVFACNRRKPQFVTIDNESQLRFFSTYRFRIDIQATIVVI